MPLYGFQPVFRINVKPFRHVHQISLTSGTLEKPRLPSGKTQGAENTVQKVGE